MKNEQERYKRHRGGGGGGWGGRDFCVYINQFTDINTAVQR